MIVSIKLEAASSLTDKRFNLATLKVKDEAEAQRITEKLQSLLPTLVAEPYVSRHISLQTKYSPGDTKKFFSKLVNQLDWKITGDYEYAYFDENGPCKTKPKTLMDGKKVQKMFEDGGYAKAGMILNKKSIASFTVRHYILPDVQELDSASMDDNAVMSLICDEDRKGINIIVTDTMKSLDLNGEWKL